MRTSYSFDEKEWGGKSSGDDSEKIREKYASGWKVDEDGNIIPTREKNKDMYRNDMFRGGDKRLGEKKARLGGKMIDGKEIDMPEYLSRQKEFATKESLFGRKKARESDSGKFRSKEGDKVANTRNKSWLEKIGLVKTESARETGKKYKTPENSELTNSWRKTVEPNPQKMQSGGGFYRNSDMSIDEVRELVSPGGVLR